MSVFKPGYLLSVGVHGVLITAAFLMHQPPPHVFKQVAVYIPPPKHKAPKEKPPEPQVEEKKKPPPPPPMQHKAAAKAATPEAAKSPEPAPSPVHAAMNSLPDFGISLSGGDMGAGVGIAVPTSVNPIGAGDAPSSTKRAQGPKEKVLHSSGSTGNAAEAADDDEVTKPKQIAGSFVQPQYSDEARAAGIEGRVKLKLTIDAQGNVTNVEVLAGLGHGLDENAIAAAKRMHFTPAMAHGKPQISTFVVSFRFVLGE